MDRPDDCVFLPFPAPPDGIMEEAFGYPYPESDAQYVTFNWSPLGDECDYDDGVSSGTGDWRGYLAFVQHVKVYKHLAPYNLGSSDAEATHCIVLDRVNRIIYVAPVGTARDTLRRQPRKVLPTIFDRAEEIEEVKSIGDLLDLSKFAEVKVDQDEVMRRMKLHAEVVNALVMFLDEN
jgi:hypothetical protein